MKRSDLLPWKLILDFNITPDTTLCWSIIFLLPERGRAPCDALSDLSVKCAWTDKAARFIYSRNHCSL